MTAAELIDRYLADLAAAASGLPANRRTELLDDVRDHIAHALERAAPDDTLAVRNVLERLGTPAEIVAAEWAAESSGVASPSHSPAPGGPMSAPPPPPPIPLGAPPAPTPLSVGPVARTNWVLVVGVIVGLVGVGLGFLGLARGLEASAWLIIIVSLAMVVLFWAEWARTGGKITATPKTPMTIESFAKAAVIMLGVLAVLGGWPLAALTAIVVLVIISVAGLARAMRSSPAGEPRRAISPEAVGLLALLIAPTALVVSGHPETAMALAPLLGLLAVVLLISSALRSRRSARPNERRTS